MSTWKKGDIAVAKSDQKHVCGNPWCPGYLAKIEARKTYRVESVQVSPESGVLYLWILSKNGKPMPWDANFFEKIVPADEEFKNSIKSPSGDKQKQREKEDA